MPALPLKRLMTKLPPTKEITLLYFDGWLSIGSVKLSAAVLLGGDSVRLS